MKICSICNGMRLEVFKDNFLCPVCKNDKLVSCINENYVKQNATPQKYNSLLENIKNIQFLEELDNETIDKKISQIGIALLEIKSSYLAESLVEYAKWIQNKNNEKKASQKNLEVSLNEKETEIQKIISTKNKKIDEIEKEIAKKETMLTLASFREKSSIDNFKYFSKLVEIIENEKNIGVEKIMNLLEEKKVEYPEFTNLQALYYVAMDYKIIFFKKWVRLTNSKYNNKCNECGGKIAQGDDIFWNPGTKKVKHFDCKTLIDQKKKISELRESANNYFVRGENHKAMECLNQIKKIKFTLIFQNSELSKTLESILLNNANFLRFLKTFEDLEWINDAKNVEFEDFLKTYQIKFVEKCKDEIQIDITQGFDEIMKNQPGKKEIFDNLVHDDYVKYSKNLTYLLNSSKGNSEIFQKIIRKCGKHGFFYDPYMNSRIIRYFIDNFPENFEMTELQLLTSIHAFTIKKHLKLMKEAVEEFKTYLMKKGTKLEVKVIQEKISEDHDRYFYGDNANLVMSQGMDRFYLTSKNATLVEIEPRFIEEFREITENRYRSESTLDFLENYDVMEKKLKEYFDAKCTKCKNNCQVLFKPKEDRPVYCRECRHKKQNRSQ